MKFKNLKMRTTILSIISVTVALGILLLCVMSQVSTNAILKQKIKVQLVNDDGSLGDTVSVKSGKKLMPLSTDGESWVTVLLPDGSTGRMTVEIKEGPDEWGVFLNGKDQDTIAYLPYSHF